MRRNSLVQFSVGQLMVGLTCLAAIAAIFGWAYNRVEYYQDIAQQAAIEVRAAKDEMASLRDVVKAEQFRQRAKEASAISDQSIAGQLIEKIEHDEAILQNVRNDIKFATDEMRSGGDVLLDERGSIVGITLTAEPDRNMVLRMAALKSLRKIEVVGHGKCDQGLVKWVRIIPHLESLSLDNVPVSELMMTMLDLSSTLVRLEIRGSAVSDEAIEELKRRLPSVEVIVLK